MATVSKYTHGAGDAAPGWQVVAESGDHLQRAHAALMSVLLQGMSKIHPGLGSAGMLFVDPQENRLILSYTPMQSGRPGATSDELALAVRKALPRAFQNVAVSVMTQGELRQLQDQRG